MKKKFDSQTDQKSNNSRTKSTSENKKQPSPTFLVSTGMEEKMATSYGKTASEYESYSCSDEKFFNISKTQELSPHKNTSEEDNQQIMQLANNLLFQKQITSNNTIPMPNINQAIGRVAKSVLNQNPGENQLQNPLDFDPEQKANISSYINTQPQYLPSLEFDDSSTSDDKVNKNTDQKTSNNANGFFHHPTTVNQNQNPNQIFLGSSDSYVYPVIHESQKRTPETVDKDKKIPQTSLKYASNQLNNMVQQPVDEGLEETKEKPKKHGCCAIF